MYLSILSGKAACLTTLRLDNLDAVEILVTTRFLICGVDLEEWRSGGVEEKRGRKLERMSG